jgi:hypothetical protein
MTRGQVSSLSIVSKIDRAQVKDKLSTDPEEIFVEIIVQSFTKLLQSAHLEHFAHVSGAAKSFINERVNA